MPELSEQHRHWVANYFTGKVQELQYHLEAIVKSCDHSLSLFARQLQIPPENHKAVIYSFSALSNTIQTLKDATRTVTGKQLEWSAISQLRHGAFMRNARNAATHDGNPIVSAWVGGRHFVPTKISRIDNKGQVIEIPAPTEDIRTLCLEFADDFCKLLRDKLLKSDNIGPLREASFSMSELQSEIVGSHVIPEFVKEIFFKNQEKIAAELNNIKHDLIGQAVNQLDAVISYCESMQKNS